MEGVIKRSVGAGFVSLVYMNHHNVHNIFFSTWSHAFLLVLMSSCRQGVVLQHRAL